MREILRELFGEAVTEETLKRFQEELGKKFVPKSDFNQRGEEVKELREKLKEQEQMERVDLQQKLSALQAQYDQDMAAAKQREEQICMNHVLDNALIAAKARNLVAVKALLNMEGISLVDGKLQGLDSQLEQLKLENGYLFEADSGNPQFIRPAASHETVSQEEFRKMTYMERLKLKKEQPGLYQSMI